jgi:hypothetical protein
MSNVHDLCEQGKPCALWAARIHDEDPQATATPTERPEADR